MILEDNLTQIKSNVKFFIYYNIDKTQICIPIISIPSVLKIRMPNSQNRYNKKIVVTGLLTAAVVIL